MKSDLALDILRDLEKGDNHVSGIATNVDRSIQSVSRSLSGLQALGTVDKERDGNRVKYFITSDGVDYLSKLEDLKEKEKQLENLKERFE